MFGRWTDEENLKYIVFLDHYKQKFACRLKRRLFHCYSGRSDYFRKWLTTSKPDRLSSAELIIKSTSRNSEAFLESSTVLKKNKGSPASGSLLRKSLRFQWVKRKENQEKSHELVGEKRVAHWLLKKMSDKWEFRQIIWKEFLLCRLVF